MDAAAFDSNQPFTRATAVERGITDRELRSPAYRRMHQGIYVSAAVPDTLVVRSRAALLAAPPGGVISHTTAARLWGGRVPEDPKIHISYPRNVSTAPDGIRIHRFRQPFARGYRHGLPVTSLSQTFVHCAVGLDLVDLVALGDRLVRRHPERLGLITSYAADWRGQGGRLARRASGYLRLGVDSVPESKLRMLMVLGGLAEPQPDVRLHDDEGNLLFRLDLGHRAQLLAIEYDGRWHRSPEQQIKDGIRRSGLGAVGWRFEIVDNEDLYETPLDTLLRLRSAQADCGIPVPARLSDEWRQHFAPRQVREWASAS